MIRVGETVDVVLGGVLTEMGASLKSLGLILILTGLAGGCLIVGLGVDRSCCLRNWSKEIFLGFGWVTTGFGVGLGVGLGVGFLTTGLGLGGVGFGAGFRTTGFGVGLGGVG